jgi:hypothetical protein
MKYVISIIKADYLQRTRSYAFLITLAISLYIAYTFVPAPGAAYTTVRVGNFIGVYNAAWIGYVTAMMTSVFLSLIGFYLVNNSIKKDIETGVGMIIAATSISNFKYLLSKALSNFLVLLSITAIVFAMSVILFFIRGNGFSFEVAQFILPYAIVTVPALFFISSLAVVAEVFAGRRPVIQYLMFFVLFNFISANVMMAEGSGMVKMLDPFGVKAVTMGMEDFVRTHFNEKQHVVSMGFNFSDRQDVKTFVFEGIQWQPAFIASRFIWIGFSLLLIWISAKFFHRFDVKEKISTKKKRSPAANISSGLITGDIKLSALPAITPAYGILPFIKTELLMLLRKGSKWFWLVNAGGMIVLVFAPLSIAHQIVLPILWFLQVSRWSDLATKEKTNRMHYFTYAAYQPVKRLLVSQIAAGIILAVALSFPLIIRYSVSGGFIHALDILAGAVFIVAFAVCLGILSGGNKLFEILFFVLTYSAVNGIPFMDYFGGMHNDLNYTGLMLAIIIFLLTVSFALRNYEIGHAI